MLLRRNLLECLTLLSCSGSIICICLNYITNISPITGIWFPLYVFILFIFSVFTSLKFLRWIMQLNKPLKYDVDALIKEYPYLSNLANALPQPRKRLHQESIEYDTNQLSIITTVLERKLVSSWYVPYISQEIGFPFACKQMLDQMIGKCFQICNEIEPKEVYVDVCAVLINHLKEYRKTLKRLDKVPNATIESLYKKSHQISDSDKKINSAEHCTNVLRVILKELVPWELWDTPHSELLVRMISRKLDNFIDNTLVNPDWLNDKLLTIINAKEAKQTVAKDNVIKDENVDLSVKETVTEQYYEKLSVESALTTLITKTTAPILQRAITDELKETSPINSANMNIIEEVPARTTEPVDIKSSPVMRQRRGRQGRNEVKIYDRIIEGSVKTWETDIDLQCISLGQDLLASLDGEITLSRLWGQDAEPEGSPNPPRNKSPQSLWFAEEDIDLELADTSPKEPSPVRKEHISPKPADALLKDLQTTVHQAKTKIGDLQVPDSISIDVPCKQYSGATGYRPYPNFRQEFSLEPSPTIGLVGNQKLVRDLQYAQRADEDEAAGMMEGLLDFGIAGLKKGLRFTGLGDDSQEKSPLYREKHADKSSPPEMGKAKSPQVLPERDFITNSVLQKEENGNSSVPPLLKQQRVISQDSVPSQAKPIPSREPPPILSLSDSPEPEYEEAADLSTSIAKLRHLLQRADTSPRTEEAWWEGARAQSSRPIDTATLADEYDMAAERNASPNQSSNNMQILDKLLQRTVTGVFNSIKTAVGAEGQAAPRDLHRWTYVTTSVELSVGGAVARLVGGRRARSLVEAAVDSLRQLPAPRRAPPAAPADLEEWCAYMGQSWAAGSELAAAAGLCSAHLTHRLATILFADLVESLISVWLDDLSAWLRRQAFAVFEQMSEEAGPQKEQKHLRKLDVDHTCAALMEKMPGVLYIFGEETLRNSVHLTVSSFSHKEINRDVIFKMLDVLAVHFKNSAALRNPSFDAN